MFNRPTVNVNSTLTPLELRDFHENLKKIIWVLRIWSFVKHQVMKTFGTCFSIDKNGLAITCAHLLQNGHKHIISARRLDETHFLFEVEILDQKPKWDITLLEIKGFNNSSYGIFARDGSLNAGQRLIHIRHPGSLVGSFLDGMVAFQCVDDIVFPLDNQKRQTYLSTALQFTSRYRIMGHIFNSEVFQESRANVEREKTFEKNLHPLVPLIQIFGLNSSEGCSGGPIFYTK